MRAFYYTMASGSVGAATESSCRSGLKVALGERSVLGRSDRILSRLLPNTSSQFAWTLPVEYGLTTLPPFCRRLRLERLIWYSIDVCDRKSGGRAQGPVSFLSHVLSLPVAIPHAYLRGGDEVEVPASQYRDSQARRHSDAERELEVRGWRHTHPSHHRRAKDVDELKSSRASTRRNREREWVSVSPVVS